MTRAFNELASPKSKGSQGQYIYKSGLSMNWRLQNPKGSRENIYTFNELASPKSKGFQGKYIHQV